jgi:hypothetical protein
MRPGSRISRCNSSWRSRIGDSAVRCLSDLEALGILQELHGLIGQDTLVDVAQQLDLVAKLFAALFEVAGGIPFQPTSRC